MIPTKPPPAFKNPEEWTPLFNDFIKKCLVKEADCRSTAAQLLDHPFVGEPL